MTNAEKQIVGSDSSQGIAWQTKNCIYGKTNPTQLPLFQISGKEKVVGSRDEHKGLNSNSTSNNTIEALFKPSNLSDILKCLLSIPLADNHTNSFKERKKKKVMKIRKVCSSGVLRVKKSATEMKKKKKKKEQEKNEVEAEEEKEEEEEDCLPLLFLVFPTLCNETRLCVNITKASFETIQHRYWVWNRKKKEADKSQDAVIYIVVVLAFYSFGIVFMMANFIRQEQRELEETKLYKQYVKVARDRWLTSRGNMANKLALQALNTFNAVPQTTDDSKITFV